MRPRAAEGAEPASELSGRDGVVALACVLGWLLGASVGRGVGIWTGVGATAIALGGTLVLIDLPTQRARLQVRTVGMAAGALLGAFMVAGTYVVYPTIARDVPLIASETARLYHEFRIASLASALVALPLVIACEELVWRGAVQAALVRRCGAVVGVGLTAVTYALAHAPLGSPLLCAVALGCGVLWGALRERTGSLVPVMLAHLMWDLTVLVIRPLA